MDRQRQVIFMVSALLLALGVILLIYGTRLGDDTHYGKYMSGGPKRGEPNLSTAIGSVFIPVSILG